MAQVQPSPTNPPPAATNGQPSTTSSNPQQTAPPLSWEGDRMFNVYIHDYFLKRGFRKAAKELVQEAEIGNDASPPINARQGFLFEWWSVFWMFFSAKTTGQGPDNVMLYFHWIQNQAERNRLQHENEQRRVTLPLNTQAPPRATRPPPNGIRPPAMVNGGVPMPQGPGQPTPPTQGLQYPMSVPHGTMSASHQQPPSGPGQSQPQINGIDPSTPHGHPMSNPQRPPSQPPQNRPGPPGSLSQAPQGHPPPSHPNVVPHLQPSQRQVPRGQHEAIRPPGQFHSPTMSTTHPPGPGQQGQLGHPHIPGMGGPMPQLGAPGTTQHLPQHQHLGRGPPPQGGQPNTASPRNPSQTPTQPYQQLMNPGGTMGPLQQTGSRSGTPGGNTLTQQSPALASREPPSQGPGQGQNMTEEMSRRFQQQQQHQLQQQRHQHQQQQQQQQHQQQQQQQQQQQHQQQQQQQQHHHHQQQQQDHQQRNTAHDQPDLAVMETNLGRIPKVFLHPMMAEAGCNDGREVENLSFEEKTRLNEVFKRTMNVYTGNTSNAPRNGSVPRSGMNQPPMSGMPMGPPPQGPSRQPTTAQRGQKRASTSPSDEQGGESTPKDQSPPERKRQRHSPPGGGVGSVPGGTDTGTAPPPMGSMGGFPPNHPGSRPGGYPGPVAPQHPQSLPNGFRGGPMGGPMNPHPGQQPVPNVGGMGMVGMVPGMTHPMPPPGMHMTPALTNQHIHQMPNPQVAAAGRPPLPSPEISYPFQNQSQQMQQQQMHYRQSMANQHLHKMPPSASNPANPNPSPSTVDPHDNSRSVTAPGGVGVGNRPPQQGKPGSMMPPPSPAHRAENTNTQKGAGMMPPPAQPVNAPGNPGGTSKEQTAPSPAGGRHEGATGSSPSIRPESRSGASTNTSVPSVPPSMPQGSGGGPATPASAGGNNGGNTTAPSPSAVLANRISPSAAMNSLPRPQTSGPDATAVGNAAANVQPPPPPSSAPPSATGTGLPSNLFGDFFDSMEDNFGLDSLESIDPAEFSQWIDMNPLS